MDKDHSTSATSSTLSSLTDDELVANAITREQKREALIELLRRWREEGDEEEQKETWEYLKKALDEDRLSYRKLFP